MAEDWELEMKCLWCRPAFSADLQNSVDWRSFPSLPFPVSAPPRPVVRSFLDGLDWPQASEPRSVPHGGTMPTASIVGPNPLLTARMTAEERKKELATILAAGVIRARDRAP